VDFASGGLAFAAGWFAGLLAAGPVVATVGVAAVLEDGDAPERLGAGLSDVVSGEIVPEDSVPTGVFPMDSAPAGDGFPTVSKLVEAAGETGVATETGSGAEAEDFCAEAGGSDAALGSA
jgi:hypothetical protein